MRVLGAIADQMIEKCAVFCWPPILYVRHPVAIGGKPDMARKPDSVAIDPRRHWLVAGGCSSRQQFGSGGEPPLPNGRADELWVWLTSTDPLSAVLDKENVRKERSA